MRLILFPTFSVQTVGAEGVAFEKPLIPVLTSYLQHRSLLLTDQHADVWVSQVSAVDFLVSASGIYMCKGLVDLQGPDAFIMHPVRGDAPLLAERPQADGPV